MRDNRQPHLGISLGRALLAAALSVSVLQVGTATAAPRQPSSEASVKVIITFRQPPGAVERRDVEAAGGAVRLKFRLINAMAATVPASKLDALRRNPRVAAVELDHEILAFHHDTSSGNSEVDAAWGVHHLGAGSAHAAGHTGAAIKVGVIDTGIDYSHPDLNDVYAGGYDFFSGDNDPMDDHGHGTHVAGSIAAELNGAGVAGVAPNAALYGYKVLGADGSGDYSHLIAALQQAVLDDVDVVTMSLGGTVSTDALQNAVAAAYDAGIVLVAASGNVGPSGEACPVAYPAAYEQVFATTFTGPDDALTGYSCTGPEVDFASPGDLINSTVPSGSCAMCHPSGYNLASGTSMASPHLVGTVALVLDHGINNSGDPLTLADDVKAHLCGNTSVGTGVTYFGFWHVPISPTDPRYPQYFGCGVTNAYKALIANPPPGADPDPTPTPTPTPTPEPTPTPTPTPTSTPTPTPSPTPSPTPNPTPALHVGDLDATSRLVTRGWRAKVFVLVHTAAENPRGGALVTASWSSGGTGSCTTKSTGRCKIESVRLSRSLTSVTFTVTKVTRSGWTYVTASNHDPDGDSNGTLIGVAKPGTQSSQLPAAIYMALPPVGGSVIRRRFRR